MDVESLEINARPRSSCIDIFLVISIIFLFVAVVALGAGGVFVAKDLRSVEKNVDVLKPSFTQGDPPAPVYKMQNFAYLQPTSASLTNSTMTWAAVHYGARTSIGSFFSFDEKTHALQPTKEGNYFMFLDLHLTCTFTCNAGLLTIRLGDKLTCRVDIPESRTTTPVTRKCWTVAEVEGGSRLVAQMTVPQGLSNWMLDLNDSKFGMFLVD